MAKRKLKVDPEQARAIGTRIAQYRVARGWSQAELAARVDVEPTTISRVETATRPAATPLLMRLAASLPHD